MSNPNLEQTEHRATCGGCQKDFVITRAAIQAVKDCYPGEEITDEAAANTITICEGCGGVGYPIKPGMTFGCLIWSRIDELNESSDYVAEMITMAAERGPATETRIVNTIWGEYLVSLLYAQGERPTDNQVAEVIVAWVD